MAEPFKSAQPEVVKQLVKQPETKTEAVKVDIPHTDAEPTPKIHQEVAGFPYLAKYHEFTKATYETLPDNVRDDTEYVDQYFQESKYANDKEGFKEFMRDLERKTDSKGMGYFEKMRRIAEFIKYTRRINET